MADFDYQSLMQAMPQQQAQPQLYNGIMQAQPQQVMSDERPDPVRAGQQFAQSSPFQMRPIGGGQVQVINIRTGQVVYTGSAAGAANAQASSAGQARRIID
jgi:hypothetical protein